MDHSSPNPDGFSPTEFNSAVTAITSAFGDTTRREIYLFVRENADGATATGVARHFNLHPNVARHHLDKLAAGGYLLVEVARHGQAGAGRPSKHYRASDPLTPVEIPVRHDDVVMILLQRALEMIPAAEATAMAEQVGRDFGQTMAESLGTPAEQRQSFQSALQAVADALTAHGFAAHAETEGDKLSLISSNCPFGDIVIANPILCAVDRGMMQGMLSVLHGDVIAETEASRVQGDDTCVTTVTD